MINDKRASFGAAICAALALASVATWAQTTQTAKPAAAKSQHTLLTADQLKCGPAPPSLPAGAQMAVITGDPAQKGVPFVVRAKLPDGYHVPPHWHPTEENVTVLSGTLMFGMGDKVDEGSMTTLAAGGFSRMPALMRHYVRAKGETVIQVHGIGPFAVTYVNPTDDPRKKTTASK